MTSLMTLSLALSQYMCVLNGSPHAAYTVFQRVQPLPAAGSGVRHRSGSGSGSGADPGRGREAAA